MDAFLDEKIDKRLEELVVARQSQSKAGLKASSKRRAEHDKVFSKGLSTKDYVGVIENDPSIMNQVPYTLAVIKEDLRLFPPAGSLRDGRPDFPPVDEDGKQYPTAECHI